MPHKILGSDVPSDTRGWQRDALQIVDSQHDYLHLHCCRFDMVISILPGMILEHLVG
jgi:hypothetical protein